MDKATSRYIENIGDELSRLADAIGESPNLDDKIDHAQELAFRAGFYADMLEIIKDKTFS